ncbi:Cro/C1-type helix-turn-helix domain [Methylophilaceae bacterium]|jgi:transcriptional regulator with XRE-family HTH domain
MIIGSTLKEKRLSLKLSQLDVAHQACLSLNQVQALEGDDATPFYSNQIRLQCLKRVAECLGIALTEIDETTTNIAPEYLLNINGPPALSIASHMHKEIFLLARGARPFVLNGLLVVSALLVVNYLLARSASEPAADVAPVKLAVQDKKTAQDLASFITEKASNVPATTPEKDLNSNTAGAEPSNIKACYEGGELATLQVIDPIKVGNKVYFSSVSPQTVCISDANNRLQRFRLNDRKGYAFRGSPPFIVTAENFSRLALFFQGKKVNLDGLKDRAIKLNANPMLE